MSVWLSLHPSLSTCHVLDKRKNLTRETWKSRKKEHHNRFAKLIMVRVKGETNIEAHRPTNPGKVVLRNLEPRWAEFSSQIIQT
jgi:hypothetical protein